MVVTQINRLIQVGTGEARMLQRKIGGALRLLARTEENRRLKAETEGACWLQADTTAASDYGVGSCNAVPDGQIRLQDSDN